MKEEGKRKKRRKTPSPEEAVRTTPAWVLSGFLTMLAIISFLPWLYTNDLLHLHVPGRFSVPGKLVLCVSILIAISLNVALAVHRTRNTRRTNNYVLWLSRVGGSWGLLCFFWLIGCIIKIISIGLKKQAEIISNWDRFANHPDRPAHIPVPYGADWGLWVGLPVALLIVLCGYLAVTRDERDFRWLMSSAVAGVLGVVLLIIPMTSSQFETLVGMRTGTGGWYYPDENEPSLF